MHNAKRKIILGILIVVFAVANVLSFHLAKADTAVEMQKQLENLAKQQKEAKAELAVEESKLSKNQTQIAATRTRINKLIADIASKERELNNLNDRAVLNKQMLGEYIRQMYYANQDQDPMIELAVFQGDLSDIVAISDGMLSIKARMLESLQVISDAKTQAELAKSELADQQSDHKQLLQTQQVQQGEIAGDIKDTKATLADLQKKFAELQSDLNKLLGSNYNAKDIKDAVGFASDKTGVPRGFLVGVLKMETNLGANVGGCTYGQVESGAMASYKAKNLGPKAWATFQARRDTFKAICSELKIDYQKQKVSCNPRGYTGTGGAMGVAQFMPDTWNAYKSQVSSITGHRPASPWNLTDGVVAMGLKLSRVPGVTAGKTAAYRTAACAYLGTCYKPYIDGILYWADNYKQIL